jgi:hypothetical protein
MPNRFPTRGPRELLTALALVTVGGACAPETLSEPDGAHRTSATPADQSVSALASSAVLVGAGDIASCVNSSDEATAKLLDGISGTVFAAGDNAYEHGTFNEYQDCYRPNWGRHKSRTLPVTGNHEYETAGGKGYFQYFGSAAGPAGKGWYSKTVGSWHVIVLNSNCSNVGGCGPTSAQGKWLAADLAANHPACTLAIWHHPRFRSGGVVGGTGMSDIWKMLYNAKAELVINGHAHFYERFAPQTVNGTADAARGLRQFIVGTGGRSHNSLGSAIPNSQVRNNTTFGVLKLTLGSGTYSWQFVPVAGKTFTDKGSGTCH